MADSGARRRWYVVPVLVLVVWLLVRGGQGAEPTDASRAAPSGAPSAPSADAAGAPAVPAPSNGPSNDSSSAPPGDPSASASGGSGGPQVPPAGAYDPADLAPQVRTHAGRAGVDPRLLMAILYNEAYKPHDPDWERAWQRYKPDASFGVANMHRAAFDETKRRHGFADRRWEELPDDRDLAVRAAAWHLHDLAAQLPARWSATYSKDELLALGYNAGSGNMLAFARGARPGSQAQSYLDRLHANWAAAGKAVSGR
ncbi:lytic transglycosylase domain-containing protein [Streptomyces sp. NPDC056061]|uniref:lytic transglycosylase domain-containing protein n=1 Tax=Streptomyces sp. NPDC056061 TaxID=3345700 RepID=UPI0035DC77D6